MLATKERPQRERSYEDLTEDEKVAQWRQFQFVQILRDAGMSDEEIDFATVSGLIDNREVSPRDLEKLIGDGCAPKTAIEILV